MKGKITISRYQLISLLLVLNLCISEILGNLYPVHKPLEKRDFQPIETGKLIQYDTQIDNLRGKPGEGYYLEVEIGTPKQKLNVLIDTGSSNFAVACEPNENIDKFFHSKQSSTYTNLGTPVNVPYTQGSWDGVLGQDYVTIATMPNSTVMANIACINKAENFFINNSNWQGIIGLGYAAITRPDSSVEPYVDSLVDGTSIDNMFGVELCGQGYVTPNIDKNVGGSLVFGSLAPSLYTGDLYATPIYKEWFYEVILVDIEVNGHSLHMDCKEYNFGKTIVDTGTTNLRLPTRVFNKLVRLIKDAVLSSTGINPADSFWTGDESLCWKEGNVSFDSFPTVSLVLPANKTSVFKLVIAPQQYLRAVGEENDDQPGNDCYKLGISALDSGSVLGAIVMAGFYVVFDRANKKLLFAESTCGYIAADAVKPHIQGNIDYSGNYRDCAYVKPEMDHSTLTIVGYVLAGICAVCLLPLLFLVLQYQCRRLRCFKRKLRRTNSDSNDLMDNS